MTHFLTLRGTKGATPIKKYPNIFLSIEQSMNKVILAPTGAVNIAVEAITMAAGKSIQLPCA